MSARTDIQLPRDKIADFCKRNQIRKLSVFGSALRRDFRDDSDIDLLVEFQPGQAPSLFDLARMERELSPQPESNMQKDDRVRLQHMLDATSEGLDFIQGKNKSRPR